MGVYHTQHTGAWRQLAAYGGCLGHAVLGSSCDDVMTPAAYPANVTRHKCSFVFRMHIMHSRLIFDFYFCLPELADLACQTICSVLTWQCPACPPDWHAANFICCIHVSPTNELGLLIGLAYNWSSGAPIVRANGVDIKTPLFRTENLSCILYEQYLLCILSTG